MRAKWSAPIRKYWKISEQMMVKYCDLAICDSVNIEKYIHECYDGKGIKGRNPKTTFIAYGADLTLSKLVDDNSNLDLFSLEMFEDLAWLMARHADPANVPDSPEEFLDQFNTFSIYQILPQLIELWGLNVQTEVESRKNLAKVSGK